MVLPAFSALLPTCTERYMETAVSASVPCIFNYAQCTERGTARSTGLCTE
jgi:hypothetical protein